MWGWALTDPVVEKTGLTAREITEEYNDCITSRLPLTRGAPLTKPVLSSLAVSKGDRGTAQLKAARPRRDGTPHRRAGRLPSCRVLGGRGQRGASIASTETSAATGR